MTFWYRCKEALIQRYLSAARWYFVDALARQAAFLGHDREEAFRVSKREAALLVPDVFARLSHTKSEIEILTERLTRRYDPASAFNEATNRAIAAKKAAKEHIPSMLGTQAAAFEYQKQFLQDLLKKS